MDATSIEIAFLDEVSAFLNTTDTTRTNVGTDIPHQNRRAEASTSDTDSSQDRASELDRFANDKPASKHLTRRQKEILRKKRYERRLKNERDTLRNMVTDLTSRLEQLRQGNKSKHRELVVPSDAVASTWRALASVRREQRHQAQQEQSRLEAAIDDQATYLETLRALLPKNMYDWVAITKATRAAILSSRLNNMQANHVLFAEHLRQVFAAYTHVDDVFRDVDVTTLPDGIAASLCAAEANNGTEYFRHFHKCSLPFSFQQTHEAWWKLTNLNQWLQEGDGYADLADSSDTVILRVRLVRTLPSGLTVSIMQRYILRRFVEETQAVFMWKTYSEGEGTFSGAYVEETGWARLQPSMEDNSTVVAVCVHQAPMLLDASKPRMVEAHEFYNVMQTLLQENAQAIVALLSKKLLEETLSPIEIM